MDNTLGRILIELEQRGISSTKFQKDLGLYGSAVSEWKNGKSKSYEKHLPKIAEYFGVSVDYLLGNTTFRTVDEAANDFEVTAEKAIADLTEWLEDNDYEVGCVESDSGSGAEWYITKDGKTRNYEENEFKSLCVSLSQLIANSDDFIYTQWAATQFEEVDVTIELNEDEAELISIFRELNRPAIHELMVKAYELKDRVIKEKTGSQKEPAV